MTSPQQRSEQDRAPSGLGRVAPWLSSRDWWSLDLLAGLVVAAGVAIGTAEYPKTRGDGVPTYLYALAAAAVALLGVVMAVMAILVGLMSPDYRSILEAIPGGLKRAMNPYFIVAAGSAFTVVACVLSALAWPSLRWWAQIGTLSGCSGLAAWMIFGSAQLLLVTFNHGTDSWSMAKHMAEVRAARDEKLRKANQGH